MDEVLAPALELDAEVVAGAPLLGYRIIEVARLDDGNAPEMPRQLQLRQPWIETENSPVTFDIEMIWMLRSFADLLMDQSEASWFMTPASEALADFEVRWAISSQLHDRVGSSASQALAIIDENIDLLVWREGMIVGAQEQLATALRLLVADFSEAARQRYAYSKPEFLISALALLPDDVRSSYVPEADRFINQATHERTSLRRDPETRRFAPLPQSALHDNIAKMRKALGALAFLLLLLMTDHVGVWLVHGSSA